MTILECVTKLRDDLLQCKCVCKADEYHVYDDMLVTVTELLTAKRRDAGYQAVYDRSGKLFEGTSEACALFVDILSEGHPDTELTIKPL